MSIIEKAAERIEALSVEKNVKQAQCHLDMTWLEQQGFLTPMTEQSHLAEEYRMIKMPLLMNASGKGESTIRHSNLVMILSALPGEGKTFTAVNLAMSMAMERDKTVLIVDSDLTNRSLSRMLGLDDRAGLIDILLDEGLDLREVIVNTDMPALKVIPAGNFHAHSTELLASDKMGDVCRELSERYPNRIVLFDASPVLSTSQARVLSVHMGQIILVVEAGKTPVNAVKQAVSLIDDERNKVIGTVLNKRRWFPGQDRYAYGMSGK